jgi:hypothetical protein
LPFYYYCLKCSPSRIFLCNNPECEGSQIFRNAGNDLRKKTASYPSRVISFYIYIYIYIYMYIHLDQ